jgi:hypothetical protein
MKSSPRTAAPQTQSAEPAPRTGRRAVVGAGVAVGAALAATTLARRAAPGEAVVAAKTAAPAGEGYRLTEHVRRYYETTRS